MIRSRRERAPRARLRRGDALVVAQAPRIADAICEALARRRPELRLAQRVVDEGGWAAAALALSSGNPGAALLVALHRPVPLEDLLRVRSARPALLLAGAARAPEHRPGLPPLAADTLARGLGLPVAATPEELVEAAWLRAAGATLRGGTLRALAADVERAALLENRLARVGLRCTTVAPASRAAFSTLVRAIARGERARERLIARACAGAAALVVDPGLELDALLLALPGVGLVTPADDCTLHAVAAMLALPPAGGAPLPRPPATAVRAACARLDGWGAALSEAQLKPLLESVGLPSPREVLAASASRATRAARSLGPPVVVKAVGPGLGSRTHRGALVLGVRTAAGARQAFRDVLDACARLTPNPTLDGVLVSQQLQLPFAIDLGMLWPEDGLPPLLLLGRRRIASGAWHDWSAADASPALDGPLALPTPLGEAEARWAASWLLRREGGGERARRRLARFIGRLAWLGPAFAGRLRWLRLDTVSPPDRGVGPLVLDARGLQTSSLRDPLAVLQL